MDWSTTSGVSSFDHLCLRLPLSLISPPLSLPPLPSYVFPAHGLLTSPEVEAVLRRVDRIHFIPIPSPPSPTFNPYADHPHPIGSLATISAPHSHCIALQLLHSPPSPPHPANPPPLTPTPTTPLRILDVGAGSGYLTTCLALLFSSSLTIGIDHAPQLIAQATATTARHYADLLHPHSRLRFHCGDGRLGLPADAPFDVIHVGVGAEGDVVQRLLGQLRVGGVMLVPEVVGAGGQQKLRLYRRAGADETVCDEVMDCEYARMRAEAPASDVDSVEQWERAGERLRAEVEQLKGHIRRWHEAFKRLHGRAPSEVDREADAELQVWLSAFHAQSAELERRRRVGERMKEVS